MLSEFLEYVLERVKVEQIDIEGRQYADREIHAIKPPLATPLLFTTLTGLVNFIKSDSYYSDDNFIHVVNEGLVKLLWKDTDDWEQRGVYAQADLSNHGERFAFGQYLEAEDFLVKMRTMFVQDEVVDRIVGLIGNMSNEQSVSTEDDGFTQRVTQKAGVVLKKSNTIVNPFALRPYRTFREIEQPSCSFILRVQEKGSGLPRCALFEADGGQWKLEAIKSISEYLSVKLPLEMQIFA